MHSKRLKYLAVSAKFGVRHKACQ